MPDNDLCPMNLAQPQVRTWNVAFHYACSPGCGIRIPLPQKVGISYVNSFSAQLSWVKLFAQTSSKEIESFLRQLSY